MPQRFQALFVRRAGGEAIAAPLDGENVPVDRRLPRELRDALHRLAALEAAADTHAQRRAAMAASTRLVLAARVRGWTVTELAADLNVEPATLRRRVRLARARGERPAAVNVPDPPPRYTGPLAVLRVPAQEREWLRFSEAVAFAGVSPETVRSWRRAGLLPNCRQVNPHFHLYLRADLRRVLAAPRYNRHGASHQAVRESITRSGV